MTHKVIVYLKKISDPLSDFLSIDISSRQMKKHLRNIRSSFSKCTSGIILVEYEHPPDSLIGLSQFLPILQQQMNSGTRSYWFTNKTKISKYSRNFRYYFSVSRHLLGKKVHIMAFRVQKDRLCSINQSEFQTKNELLSYTYKGIHIGDLIYDRYLVEFHSHTVDMRDPNLEKIRTQFEYYVDEFSSLLNSSKVTAICVTHTVYQYGIAARLGISRAIPVFFVSAHKIFRINSNYPQIFTDEKEFPSQFATLEDETKKMGIAIAKNRLQARFQGFVGPDLPYMTTSAFNSNSIIHKRREKTDNQNIRILVAMHDFYDSPHVFGTHFYPDFYEWLIALARISTQTNYQWLIKTHPFVRGNGRKVLSEFVQQNENFELLPIEITHNELLNSGIDYALTVYGTIAMEYAALGVSVINATRNNPHVNYNFSFTPRDVAEYEKILLDLNSFRFEPVIDDVYKFYFMKHVLHKETWVYLSYEKYLLDTDIGSLKRRSYSYFLNGQNVSNVSENQVAIREFLQSTDIRLSPWHYSSFSEKELRISLKQEINIPN